MELIDRHYRGGMYRYRCRVCHEAGDPGEGGTFTDLTGTLFDGSRLDIRSLWLIVEAFVHQVAAVGTADEVQVNRHTVDRYFRLFRAAIYLARPHEPLAVGPEDIVEGDEVYITAGLKGRAGRQTPNRAPRRRGLKRRGRGTWDNDRVPILGLVCRGGEVRLVTLRNVQTATIAATVIPALAGPSLLPPRGCNAPPGRIRRPVKVVKVHCGLCLSQAAVHERSGNGIQRPRWARRRGRLQRSGKGLRALPNARPCKFCIAWPVGQSEGEMLMSTFYRLP